MSMTPEDIAEQRWEDRRSEAAHSSPGAVCDNGCAVMLAAKAALEKAGGAVRS